MTTGDREERERLARTCERIAALFEQSEGSVRTCADLRSIAARLRLEEDCLHCGGRMGVTDDACYSCYSIALQRAELAEEALAEHRPALAAPPTPEPSPVPPDERDYSDREVARAFAGLVVSAGSEDAARARSEAPDQIAAIRDRLTAFRRRKYLGREEWKNLINNAAADLSWCVAEIDRLRAALAAAEPAGPGEREAQRIGQRKLLNRLQLLASNGRIVPGIDPRQVLKEIADLVQSALRVLNAADQLRGSVPGGSPTREREIRDSERAVVYAYWKNHPDTFEAWLFARSKLEPIPDAPLVLNPRSSPIEGKFTDERGNPA